MSILSFLSPKSAIYVLNESTVCADAEVYTWCKAVQKQIKVDVAPVWGRPPKSVLFRHSTLTVPKNAWVIAVLDNADQADALGYHSVDRRGRVYGRVFAATALKYGESPSVTFSHEVLETWGDPGVGDIAGPHGNLGFTVPLELCDAVEGDSYMIDNVEVSNFLHPAWFGLSNGSTSDTRLDFMGTAPGPFKVAPRGYTVRIWPGGTTDQVFGQQANINKIRDKRHALGRIGRIERKAARGE